MSCSGHEASQSHSAQSEEILNSESTPGFSALESLDVTHPGGTLSSNASNFNVNGGTFIAMAGDNETKFEKFPRISTMLTSIDAAKSRSLSEQVIAALLKTNDIPPEDYTPAIRKRLGEAQDRLIACQAERDTLYGQRKIQDVRNAGHKINEMNGRINRLECQIWVFVSILSPVRRVPAEILCEISHFWLAAEKTGHQDRFRRPPPTAPWCLACVCRYWRAAVRGDPHLWTYIRIDRYALNWREPLAAVDAQVELSMQTPLRIELLDVPDNLAYLRCPNDGMPTFADILRTLVSCSNRWQTLTLSLSNLEAFSSVIPILSTMKGHLGGLQSLRIEGPFNSWPKEFENLFEETSKLQKALLGPRLGENSTYPPLGIAWSHLTCLDIYARADVLLGILQQTADLQDLVMEGWDSDEPLLSTLMHNVVVHKLRRLLVVRTEMVRYLTTPALEFLHLVLGSNTIIPDFPDFLLRSKCQLRLLALTASCEEKPDIDAVEKLLQAVPSLLSLELWCQRYGMICYHQVLERLIPLLATEPTANDTLCPKLISLCIQFPGETIAKKLGIPLCEMLESRWGATGEQRFLRSVRLKPDDLRSSVEFTPAVWRRLDALRTAGLDIEGLRSTFDG
ncbi:hypothetical protein R3P38DRAFT_3045541 [Favolaschia claudopus]|uniref:F-box domain-containing protein n=1 Tax=Favolaschia claudopus TaxID=2862362 RepID=A0AAW0A6M9_9AGAR